jgi:hypothetical protein
MSIDNSKMKYIMYGSGALLLAGGAFAYFSYTKYQEAQKQAEDNPEDEDAKATSDQWKMYGIGSAAVAVLSLGGLIYSYRKLSKEHPDELEDEGDSPQLVSDGPDEDDIELEEEQMMVSV